MTDTEFKVVVKDILQAKANLLVFESFGGTAHEKCIMEMLDDIKKLDDREVYILTHDLGNNSMQVSVQFTLREQVFGEVLMTISPGTS